LVPIGGFTSGSPQVAIDYIRIYLEPCNAVRIVGTTEITKCLYISMGTRSQYVRLPWDEFVYLKAHAFVRRRGACCALQPQHPLQKGKPLRKRHAHAGAVARAAARVPHAPLELQRGARRREAGDVAVHAPRTVACRLFGAARQLAVVLAQPACRIDGVSDIRQARIRLAHENVYVPQCQYL
jgi:hypothetical protein